MISSGTNLAGWVTTTADRVRKLACTGVKCWRRFHRTRRDTRTRAVAADLLAQPSEPTRWTDGEIASAAAQRIDLMTSIPSGALKITVRQGSVTLEGRVEWDYQQTAAGNAVKYLSGVKEVMNLIDLRAQTDNPAVAVAQVPAFNRHAARP